jgi:hypothetical protein
VVSEEVGEEEGHMREVLVTEGAAAESECGTTSDNKRKCVCVLLRGVSPIFWVGF